MEIQYFSMRIVCLFLLAFSVLSIQIKNRRFYDDLDRQILFHGPNVVVKVPPYMPVTDSFNPMNSISQQDLQYMHDWGMNGMRLGIMWAGVEPNKDQYNETYLSEMLKLVNLAGSKYNIYTLLDFHQDLIAEQFCGDGIPTWLMDEIGAYKTFPWPLGHKIKLNSSHLPSWDDCDKSNWGDYYFSDDVGRTFNHLYSPTHKLNHKFTDFWKKVATVFKNNPYVLAYELINEPFVGDFVRNPTLIIPSVAERLKFQSFYDRLAQQIRNIDPRAVIAFEPVTFDNTIPVGFSHAPGGRKYENQSILSYHYYKPPALGLSTVTARIKDGKRLNVPSLLSQFFGVAENNEAITIAEDNLQSWLFWDFKDFGKNWGSTYQMFSMELEKPKNLGTGMFDENGKPNPSRLSALSRTYMQRTAGHVEKSTYIHDTKYFSIIYNATPKGTSILYLNKQVNYPNGYNIVVTPASMIKVVENGNYVSITFLGDSITRAMVSVTHY